MGSKTISCYICDLSKLIQEKAIESQRAANESGDLYDLGMKMAYYEIITLMQSQAIAFGIPLDAIALDKIDPDTQLL